MTDEDKLVIDEAMGELAQLKTEMFPFFEASPPLECFVCGRPVTHGHLTATLVVCDSCYAGLDQ